jgi:transposase-like protein
MQERGGSVDHSTINRWVVKYSPQFEAAFHRRKRPVWRSWAWTKHTSACVGNGGTLYGAVDKSGQTIDSLLTEHRDRDAALRFLTEAIRRHGLPETMKIDGSEANASAIRAYNEAYGTAIAICQLHYPNNIVEQDHRAVKRITRPMPGFKSFEGAQVPLVGIELMHMIRKGQLIGGLEQALTGAEQFSSLAAYPPSQQGAPRPRSKFATHPSRG